MKKHVSQMRDNEKKYLINRFKSIPESGWDFNKYSKKRATKRGVDMALFRDFWAGEFELIEYHKHDETGDNRILLRTINTDDNDYQVCAVFNFSTKEVTTVYLNWRNNKHNNLVLSEYTSAINVKEYFFAG